MRLLGYEAYPDRSSASQAEYRIKQMAPAEKRRYAEDCRSAVNDGVPAYCRGRFLSGGVSKGEKRAGASAPARLPERMLGVPSMVSASSSPASADQTMPRAKPLTSQSPGRGVSAPHFRHRADDGQPVGEAGRKPVWPAAGRRDALRKPGSMIELGKILGVVGVAHGRVGILHQNPVAPARGNRRSRGDAAEPADDAVWRRTGCGRQVRHWPRAGKTGEPVAKEPACIRCVGDYEMRGFTRQVPAASKRPQSAFMGDTFDAGVVVSGDAARELQQVGAAVVGR